VLYFCVYALFDTKDIILSCMCVLDPARAAARVLPWRQMYAKRFVRQTPVWRYY
jgi:hypothetical protein